MPDTHAPASHARIDRADYNRLAPAAYAAMGQGFPPELAGRVATAINGSMLVMVFILQYVIGAIIDLWPQTASGGWHATGYAWAMGLTLALQARRQAQAQPAAQAPRLQALASWAPARARASPAGDRSEVLVIPTSPSAFQTRTVMALRWAPFICLASPRSTCTEVSVLQAAPRSHCWMPWAEASRSRVLRSWLALRPVFTVVLVMISGPPR